jgi:hypothetical protein
MDAKRGSVDGGKPMVVCIGVAAAPEPRGPANMPVPRGKLPEGDAEIFDERG